jgi:hypothetical protein
MQREEMELLAVRATLWRRWLITVSGRQCEHYRSRVTLKCHARPCVTTWVDWWRSVCLNAQRTKPSCLPRNFGRLRSSGRYACFARELWDYCDPLRFYEQLITLFPGLEEGAKPGV